MLTPSEQAEGTLPPGAPEGGGREPINTIVDRTAAAPSVGRDTANLGKFVTREMSSRWSVALAELEELISKARRLGGAHASAAARASELALIAGEMVPRVERAAKTVGELQAKADWLEATGREFRTNLGHAIDMLVHDRSRERAHLDALRARRQALERVVATGIISVMVSSAPDTPLVPSSPGESTRDPRPWEIEALKAEERRGEEAVNDLAFQIETLHAQLESKNEEHERDLVQATGALEGSLSALRRLTSEIVRTIDDGIDILQRSA